MKSILVKDSSFLVHAPTNSSLLEKKNSKSTFAMQSIHIFKAKMEVYKFNASEKLALSELQIRGGIEDNSKISFLISQ